MPTLVSIFGVEPRRIGGTETFARELSLQLGARGWQSVLCFLSEPTEEVRRFLDLPNAVLRVYASAKDSSVRVGKNLAGITLEHSPEILHLHYMGFLNFYSWIARLQSVKKIFFTDHHSRFSRLHSWACTLLETQRRTFYQRPAHQGHLSQQLRLRVHDRVRFNAAKPF